MPRLSMIRSLYPIFFLTALSACSPVKFSAENQSKDTEDPVTPQSRVIQCNPRMNGSQTSLTITAGAANPTFSASCTPSTVDYSWTVTRGGSSVTIPNLSGASSTPNFSSQPVGTYLINLTATSSGWTTYNTSSPLQLTIESASQPSNVVCDPRLNGSQTSVSVSSTTPSVTVTSSCSPANAAITWTVTRAGTAVTIPSLVGTNSQPNFYAQGPGVYQIQMTATASGYNSYALASPLQVTVPQAPTGTPVTSTHKINLENNKLDILLVIDDSKSMLADNRRLAARLSSFVDALKAQGFNWQMCATLTRAQRVSSSDPKSYWGASYIWKGNPNTPAWILKSGTPGLKTIFSNTIEAIGAGWAGTDDERAIKSAYWHLWNGEPDEANNSGCYRQDAGLAVIVLSDEDERSIGGDQSQAYYDHEKNKPLEADDLPLTYVNKVKSVFGSTKRFTVNSIIVRPSNQACMKAQDAEGSKSHFGVHYAQLSNMTQGYVGNICDTDYASNLNYFKDSIIRSQASIPLQCTPTGSVTVTVTPNYSYATSVQGNLLVFNPQIPAGSTVNLQYTCP